MFENHEIRCQYSTVVIGWLKQSSLQPLHCVTPVKNFFKFNRYYNDVFDELNVNAEALTLKLPYLVCAYEM